MIFEGKRILVTGATGSMGRIFVRRVLSGEAGVPRKIIAFSRCETKQYAMRADFLKHLVGTGDVVSGNFLKVLEFRIGDVRNYADVCSAVRDVDIIVNAAALKQVPTCEYCPIQAALTNIGGAANIVRAIEENHPPVETVVAISTDKACRPANAMGMTKAIQERILTAANVLNPGTRFICVRYGNVLASRGSVIPLFHAQIRQGGPVTITMPTMTRFLLSTDEAVDTVFAAIDGAKRGEIYVPKAPSATIINLARALIGQRRIGVVTTGIRPGEKVHEILISDEEAPRAAARGDYFAVRPMLPELASGGGEESPLTKEFSSLDKVLDLEETIELLRRHRLMVEDVRAANGAEPLC